MQNMFHDEYLHGSMDVDLIFLADNHVRHINSPNNLTSLMDPEAIFEGSIPMISES